MKNFGIVTLFGVHWKGQWQRHHQLISRLSKHFKILYIDSPRDFITFLKDFKDRKITLLQILNFKKESENIFVHSPIIPFSLRRYPTLNKLYLFLIYLNLKRLIRKLEFKDIILFLYSPYCEFFINKFNEKLSIYDCCDEHSELVGKRLKNKIKNLEGILLKKIDIVITTSENLFIKKSKFAKNTSLIPNAVDFNHFNSAFTNNFERPIDLPSSPIIGFFGAIKEWIDLELIYFTCEKIKNVNFVLIGSLDKGSDKISNPNLYFLGHKEYKILPQYLKHFDVCLLPFKINELTKSVSPIKMFEYMASGKPIVSTNLPEPAKYGDIIYVAENREDFVKKIELALDENDQNLVQKRIQIAIENTWDRRVDDVLNIIPKFLGVC